MQQELAPQPKSAKNRRQWPRRPLLWQATLQCGHYEFDCWIYDLSLSGARIRFGLPLANDCAVVLDINNVGPISGRIAWSRSGLTGVEFILPPQNIRKLLGKRAKLLGLG